LQALRKLFLRLAVLYLSAIYETFYVIKVYRLKKINELLLYSLCIIYYVRKTKRNGLKRKS
jgi:hypothetical protein